ncbi:hypothetical protein [Muricoccus radiodurans]|uniref:hypothetical protein n=1 Tax=Muricoccus radiodurans TaxID=2231721 RepID=UPI003CE9D2C7
MDRFAEQASAYIELVYGIAPPNDAALGFLGGLAAAIEQTRAIRDRLRFEDEPAGFEAALRDLKEEA